MSLPKIVLLASALTLALTAAAPARESGELEIRERALMYINPTTGKVQVMRMGARGHDRIMNQARPLPAGSLIYRSNGRLYVVEDKNDKMMQDIAKGDYD